MRRLQVIETIGAGAFGTVYQCRLISAQGFQRVAALKVLQAQASTQMFLSRIRDEARLLGLLHDDSIINVIDLLEIDSRPAVLMEYIEGMDLESLLLQGKPPPPRALAELGASVAGALGRAHQAKHPTTDEPLNVIHRDVKPANIMIATDGSVRLLDFGVARACFDARESSTGQLMLGTLNYMAPEYVVTGEVTVAADIYGLGLSLLQAATQEDIVQPKVRKKDHLSHIDETLSHLPVAYQAFRSGIEDMLAWEPEHRPAAATCETRFDDLAQHLTGPSLRSWGREVVASALQNRDPIEDEARLVGREIVLDELLIPPNIDSETTESLTAPTFHESERTDKIDDMDATESLLNASAPAYDGVNTQPISQKPFPPHADTPQSDSSSRESRNKESLTGPILTGLFVGGIIGLLILSVIALLHLGEPHP